MVVRMGHADELEGVEGVYLLPERLADRDIDGSTTTRRTTRPLGRPDPPAATGAESVEPFV